MKKIKNSHIFLLFAIILLIIFSQIIPAALYSQRDTQSYLSAVK